MLSIPTYSTAQFKLYTCALHKCMVLERQLLWLIQLDRYVLHSFASVYILLWCSRYVPQTSFINLQCINTTECLQDLMDIAMKLILANYIQKYVKILTKTSVMFCFYIVYFFGPDHICTYAYYIFSIKVVNKMDK